MLMSGMAFLAVSPTSAQTEQTVLRSCAEPGKLRVARGALVRVECDSAFVYNKPAELVLRRKDRVNDSLNRVTDSLLRVKDSVAATLRALVALRDSINAVKSAVILELRQIHQIEQRSYDSLRVLLQVTDTAARASVANTDRALNDVKDAVTRVRFGQIDLLGHGRDLLRQDIDLSDVCGDRFVGIGLDLFEILIAGMQRIDHRIKPGGESGFHWSGFGVGAAVGVLTNWLLMKVVR